jgi:hypothetical protein
MRRATKAGAILLVCAAAALAQAISWIDEGRRSTDSFGPFGETLGLTAAILSLPLFAAAVAAFTRRAWPQVAATLIALFYAAPLLLFTLLLSGSSADLFYVAIIGMYPAALLLAASLLILGWRRP